MSDATRLSSALADRYRIERELGQGGMATVYLAHDVRHDRKVALKVLRPELSAILGGERFLKEIRTTANLQHAHILGLFDSGEADGTVFYVMPFVDGESLRDRLRREKQLPVSDALQIAREVASALDYAHRHGVVHRDIKPENILLHEGQALVADFGIALAASRTEGTTRITETGMSLGTPHYMAPEQAMGERDITPKADIYALGCVLYEMLTGEPPFTGPTAQAIVARVMTEQPRSVTLQRHTVPAAVDGAVRCALEKLPADRYATAAEFSAALSSGATAATGAALPRVLPTVERPRRAAVPWVANLVSQRAAAWLVALAAIVLAAWALLKPGRPQPVFRFGVAIPDSAQLLPEPPYRSIALSPDGSHLVYVGRSARGQRQLYVRALEGLDPRPLPGTEGAASPFFSPDGRWVAFFAERSLKKVALAGGPPLSITEAAGGRGGAWGPSGRIVFSPGQNVGLLSVMEGGGRVESLTVVRRDSGETSHRWPVFLPGGEAVLFTMQYGGRYRIAVLTLADRKTHVLLEEAMSGVWSSSGHLVYASETGALLAVPFDARRLAISGSPVSLLEGIQVNQRFGSAEFAISPTGILAYLTGSMHHTLAIVDRNGREQVLRELAGADGPRFSPDGRRIALSSVEQGHMDVRILHPETGTLVRRTFDAWNIQPEWTPDGSRISFASTAGGRGYRLYWTRADGGDGVSLLSASGSGVQTQHSWAPDGRSLVFREINQSTAFDLMVLSMDSSRVPQPYLVSRFDEFMPAVSPDGRWLAYVSNESGPNEVYVREFPVPAGMWQVSSGGASEPRWAPDGRELFYRSGDSLISVAVTTRPTFAVGARRTLFVRPYTAGINHAGYDVHPDGRRFVMVKGESDRPHLVVTVNVLDELRRRGSGTESRP